MDFFPCFLDIDKHQPTIAFGYSNIEATKHDLMEYMKSSKLSQIFDGDKLLELFDNYAYHLNFIQRFTKWANWYIYDRNPNTRPFSRESDDEIITKWLQNVYSFYEKYRIAQSAYERILYAQLLNDHLWNPKFDPRNPRIQEYNKERLLKVQNRNNTIMESIQDDDIDFSPIYDGDSHKLISLKMEADFMKIYNNCSLNIKSLIESNNIDGVKLELTKLQFMNTLIETNYIFTDTPCNNESYNKYTVLRNSIRKSLNECVDFITLKESTLNMNSLYESSLFYETSMNEHRHLLNYKEFIKESI